MASDSVFLGVSYSLGLADYKAAARRLPSAEVLPSPYGLCAGVAMSQILRWMARVRAEDVTLCVFEDGGIDHHQVRQVAAAEGVDRGEPVQSWPREWRDDRDRRRLLRPLVRERLARIFDSLAAAAPVI